MKIRFIQFLAVGILAGLAVVLFFAIRPQIVQTSGDILVTGNSNSPVDFNNPMGLSMDPYTYPNEADSIDLQSEQYRNWVQNSESYYQRPTMSSSYDLTFDDNNPQRVLNESMAQSGNVSAANPPFLDENYCLYLGLTEKIYP